MKLVNIKKIQLGKKYYTTIGKFVDLVSVVDIIDGKAKVKREDNNRLLIKLRSISELYKRG